MQLTAHWVLEGTQDAVIHSMDSSVNSDPSRFASTDRFHTKTPTADPRSKWSVDDSAYVADVAKCQAVNSQLPPGESGSASRAQATIAATVKTAEFTVQPESLPSACTADISRDALSVIRKAARLVVLTNCSLKAFPNAQAGMTASGGATVLAVQNMAKFQCVL